jgi:hypothetical protein
MPIKILIDKSSSNWLLQIVLKHSLLLDS